MVGGIDMTQEDKELLLKDLCARLPYGVKCENYNHIDGRNVFKVTDIRDSGYICGTINNHYYWAVFDPLELKPYLFPLSSMTEKQKEELNKNFNVQLLGNTIYSIHYHSEGCWDTDLELDLQDWLWFINWCYKNHFDVNNLIEKGLLLMQQD